MCLRSKRFRVSFGKTISVQKILKEYPLLLLITCLPLWADGQISATVRDSLSKEPLPYVNVWIQEEAIGTTTDLNGSFLISAPVSQKHLIVSAVGYKVRKIAIEKVPDVIYLTEQPTVLEEVIVRTRKESQQQATIGSFKKSKISFFFRGIGAPWIVGRSFPFNPSYSNTPYIKTISIVTKSAIPSAMLSIRLYEMRNGIPGNTSLHSNNIIVFVKKGTNITTVDLSSDLIRFPETGVLIGIEFLIVDENKRERSTAKNQATQIIYEPSVGTIPDESGTAGWIYSQGRWNRPRRNPSIGNSDYQNKFSLPAIQITLTN